MSLYFNSRKDSNKNFLQISKRIFILFLISSIALNSFDSVKAEEDYLIVRITDADFPPQVYIYEGVEAEWAFVHIYCTIEIENPTEENIPCSYGCLPTLYPHLEFELEEENNIVELSTVHAWPVGVYNITPGVHERTSLAELYVSNYTEEINYLPAGNYTLWYDYTNCSTVPVPVITYKMFINVNSTNISYSFEHTNSTKIYDFDTLPTSTINQNFSNIIALITPIILVVIFLRRKKK